MKRKKTVLILCSIGTNVKPAARKMEEKDVDVLVVNYQNDAVWEIRERLYNMIIVESGLDESSPIDFLSEARRVLPNTLRAILETKPLDIPFHDLINDVAPSAVFKDEIDVDQVMELLKSHRISADGMTQAEEDDLIGVVSDKLDVMLEDPKLALPVLPEIAQQVNRLLVDEKNSFKKISEWVEREQSMSARLLQAANSPIYATRDRIRNLPQAVSRLGLRQTRNLLQAVITENLFRTELRELERMVRDLWLHSICVAYCNERIALSLKMEDSEDCFMMGLLHDVGKLLIFHLIEIGRKKQDTAFTRLDVDTIRRLIVLRHNDIGLKLTRAWSYPVSIQEIVRRHNDYNFLVKHSEPLIVTHFSNMAAKKIGYTCVPHDGPALSDLEIAKALNMSKELRGELENSLVDTIERIKRSCFAEFHARAPSKGERNK